MNRQLTQVLQRLNEDRRFRQAFRRDPEAATRAFHLTSAELDALRSGDEARLDALGADVAAVQRQPVHPGRLAVFALAIAPAVAVLLLTLSIGSQAGPAGMRRAWRIRDVQRSGIRARVHGARTAKRMRFGQRTQALAHQGRLSANPIDLA